MTIRRTKTGYSFSLSKFEVLHIVSERPALPLRGKLNRGRGLRGLRGALSLEQAAELLDQNAIPEYSTSMTPRAAFLWCLNAIDRADPTLGKVGVTYR